MRIQHNIMAMSAYRNYTNNVSAMKKNLEKLSSGYKINRAGDDAAGLAISEKMRAQITGLETAQKNAKDGISLVQTAEGALTEVHDMLNRMVELATMSANGTYDNTTDRAQLQKELNQLRSEIDRIADSANFNGMKLLNGELDGTGASSSVEIDFTAGTTMIADANIRDGQQTVKDPAKGKYSVDFSQAVLSNNGATNAAISFAVANGTTGIAFTLTAGSTLQGADIAKAFLNAISTATGAVGAGVTALTGAKIQIDGTTFNGCVEGSKLVFEMDEIPTTEFSSTPISAVVSVSVNGSAAQFGGNSSSVTSSQGEQFQVTTEQEAVSKTGRVYAQATINIAAASIVDGAAIKIGDTNYIFAVGKDSKFKDQVGAANVIDLTDTPSGASASLHDAMVRLAEAAADNKQFYVGTDVTTGAIALTEKEGGIDYSVYNLAGNDGKAVANGATATGDATSANWGDLVMWGSAEPRTVETFATGKSLMLQIGDTADPYNQLRVDIKDMHVSSLGISDADISIAEQDDAANAIDKIKAAINMVSDLRGTLGATQNRLDHTINNLSVMTENIQDAESTIRDVDVAEEMMAYTKNNILIQSAQAMLAQANQVPQGVLQLLQ